MLSFKTLRNISEIMKDFFKTSSIVACDIYIYICILYMHIINVHISHFFDPNTIHVIYCIYTYIYFGNCSFYVAV